MAEIDHDAAIRHTRQCATYTLDAADIGGDAKMKLEGEWLDYVANLAERAKKLEEELRAAYDCMNYLGDILNNHDMVLEEDEKRTGPAFKTVRDALASLEFRDALAALEKKG